MGCQERKAKQLATEIALVQQAKGTSVEHEPVSEELTKLLTLNQHLKYQLNHLRKVCAGRRLHRPLCRPGGLPSPACRPTTATGRDAKRPRARGCAAQVTWPVGVVLGWGGWTRVVV